MKPVNTAILLLAALICLTGVHAVVAGEAAKKDDPNAAQPTPAPDAAVPDVCPNCQGLGIVPNLPYRLYIRFENQAKPNPEFPAQWKVCPKCKAAEVKGSPQRISDDMREGQVQARENHRLFEDLAGSKKLEQFETPFVTVHSMLPAAQNKKVADALEKCAGLLQTNSKSMVLVSTRANADNLILVSDEPTLRVYIDNSLPNIEPSRREMYLKGTGLFFPHRHMLAFGKPGGSPPENRAVYAWGRMAMQDATDQKAKPWIVEGFGAYCENATLNMNTMYAIDYEMNLAKFGKSWAADVKKLAKDGRLKHWAEIYNIELEYLKAADYLHCYSIVSFLIKLEPQRFDRFVLLLKDGMEEAPAIEKAYGKKITELEGLWKQWIPTQN